MSDPLQPEFELMPPSTKGMVRPENVPASHKAADSLKPHLSRIQVMVMSAFQEHGPMIDEELVNLPVFREWKDSTIWKRRSELVAMGKIIYGGEKKNSRQKWMTIWRLA